MKKNKGRLTLQERERIYSMRSSGYGIRKIGRLIGRNCSVVSRELKGSRQEVRLFSHLSVLDRARHAHNAALVRRRRSRVRERLKNVVVRHYVMERLKKHHWSPSSISARIGGEHPGHSISSRAIYDFIRYDHDHLKNYLVEGGKKRRQRVVNRRGRFREGAPEKRSIDERCVEANDRLEIGHLEGDTIVSCRGTAGGLLTLRDRRSRKITVRRVACLEAEHVKSVIKGVLSIKKSEERRTLTVDNGGEFSSRTG